MREAGHFDMSGDNLTLKWLGGAGRQAEAGRGALLSLSRAGVLRPAVSQCQAPGNRYKEPTNPARQRIPSLRYTPVPHPRALCLALELGTNKTTKTRLPNNVSLVGANVLLKQNRTKQNVVLMTNPI